MPNKYYIIGLIFLCFFVISLLTNILGPLIPDIIDSYDLSLSMAAFMPFSLFIAYGLASIPSGMMVEKYREKRVMVIGFSLNCLGALLFALMPTFGVALCSLFLMGSGMAMLQVAINPLLREAGGEENFAFNAVIAQLIFGGASYVSPQVYTYLVKNLEKTTAEQSGFIQQLATLVPQNLPWVSLYWVFALIALVMVAVIATSRLPKVDLKEEEKVGTWALHLELLKNKTVLLYFLGIFFYVGSEQGVANWMSKFLETYHGLDPQTVGADAVSNFWGFMMIGALLGLVLLKLMDSRHILSLFTSAAMLSFALALFGSAKMALWAFPMVGFFASVMWSVIFSLALNSFKEHHGSFSGILVTGIVGGAVVPLIVGALGDVFGLKMGMLFLFLPFAYILSIGFWAQPLVNNKRMGIFTD